MESSVGYNGMDKLGDDIVVHILSLLRLKEAARASVLASRWRYLWMFAHKTLRFDQRDRDRDSDRVMESERFVSWVDAVLNQVHRYQGEGEGEGICMEGVVISLSLNVEADRLGRGRGSTSRAVDRWVHFVMQKKLQTLVLNLSRDSRYIFPNYKTPYPCRLRSLRLSNVDVRDRVLREYFLASSSHMEDLCIHSSHHTQKLQVMDPPRLRILEIKRCLNINTLEVSAPTLVSLTFEGKDQSLVLIKTPNLRQLTLSGDLALLFLIKPKKHRTYSSQLENLVLDFRYLDFANIRSTVACPDLPKLCSLKRLELQVYKTPNQSLLFFILLIEASPLLREFRVELSYPLYPASLNDGKRVFPNIIMKERERERETEAAKYVEKKLKVVEVGGFIGLASEEQLMYELYKSYGSIRRIVIDTESNYYHHPPPDPRSCFGAIFNDCKLDSTDTGPGATTRDKARKRATHFVSKFPPPIKCIVI